MYFSFLKHDVFFKQCFEFLLLQKANGKILVKSGSDFKEFSKISIHFDENSNRHEFDVVKVTLDGSVKEDEEVNAITDEFLGK